MRPLLQHAARSVSAHAAWVASGSSRSFGTLIRSRLDAPSICLSCQLRSATPPEFRGQRGQLGFDTISARLPRRQFATSRPLREAEKKPTDPSQAPEASSDPKPTSRVIQIPPPEPVEVPKSEEAAPRKQEQIDDNIKRVPAEDLPSHREGQRWSLSKRISDLMDDLLPKLAVVTQKVNTYTGTDYSGIAALRREIQEQEQLVKTRRLAIDTAKHSLDEAHAQQASSQKEVVALLERKHSWSAADLERYMALIRSEHINDQAVREAKEAVLTAENALEEARTQLEKRERAQYHEEQIWSDTIRRNSTWITFVLMGVNIFLLLANVVVIEPWRRRRMVREIKTALEAQKAAMEAASPTVPATSTSSALLPTTAPSSTTITTAVVESEIDQVVEPAGTTLEHIETTTVPDPNDVAIPEAIAEPVPEPAVPGAAPLTPEEAQASPQETIDIDKEVVTSSTLRSKLNYIQARTVAIAEDVVSERIISMRRIDFTTAVLQGAAAGAVITAAAIAIMLRVD